MGPSENDSASASLGFLGNSKVFPCLTPLPTLSWGSSSQIHVCDLWSPKLAMATLCHSGASFPFGTA